MLKPENRLKKVRDFNLLIKHGRWVNGSFLDVKYVKLDKIQDYFPKKEDKESFKKQLRLAIVVGTKVSKSAVKRNGLKRKMREVVRLLVKEERLASGYYIMILARPIALDKSYANISQETKLLLKKIKVLV